MEPPDRFPQQLFLFRLLRILSHHWKSIWDLDWIHS